MKVLVNYCFNIAPQREQFLSVRVWFYTLVSPLIKLLPLGFLRLI